MTIEAALKSIRKDLPTVFVLRHAERYYTEDPQKDHKCELTAQGKVSSVELGRFLSQHVGKISQVMSSPADRCVETGRGIIDGNQNTITVQNLQFLAEAYVYDGKKAVVNFQANSVLRVIQKQLLDDHLIGMRSKNEGTQLLLQPILSALESDGVSMYITHDAVLGTFYGTLAEDYAYDKDGLNFGFLDGICLQKDTSGEIILYRNDNNFNVAAKVNQLQSMSSKDSALVLFAIKEIIENAPSIKYLFTEVIKPLFHPIIPTSIENIEIPSSLNNNYLWVGAHLLTSLSGALLFPSKGVTFATKTAVSVLNTGMYSVRVYLIDNFKEFQLNEFRDKKDYSIHNSTEFLTKCGSDILMHSALGALNTATTKLFIPCLGLSTLWFDVFSSATIGGLQCYTTHKELSGKKGEEQTYGVVPYLMDAAYIMYNIKKGYTSSFNSFYEGFFTVKKGSSLLCGLVLTDYLTKLTISMVPTINEEYIKPFSEYICTIGDSCFGVLENSVGYLHSYFVNPEAKEEL